MAATLRANTIMPGQFSNYRIGGNLCNAFALGEIGAPDDFFLIGAEPPDESSYPVLTGTILDSEGHTLFRLVRNVLNINPGNCSKVTADRIGYEVHDSAGAPILSVSTVYDKEFGGFVTSLAGNFYDRTGKLVFRATSGGADERIESNVKAVFGFSGGGLGIVQWMNEPEQTLARVALTSRGAIHQLLTGDHTHEEIILDGKALKDVRLRHCRILVSTGEFTFIANVTIDDCTFALSGPAGNIQFLIEKTRSAA